MKPISAWSKSGNFRQTNWNCPLCIRIRNLLMELTGDHNKEFYQSARGLRIDPWWFADQNYYSVFDFNEDFMWFVTWYKSRGKTDMILFQGQPCPKHSAKKLLSLLRRESNILKHEQPKHKKLTA
jgi:hypothetical protein